ncbi:MAG: hypothetical protein M3Y51_07325 [Actinomycetota bacterium]|nr:hypothetical protein [Actinomycetota bacterium]
MTCQVWLDQLLDRSGRSQEICELHAERLTVPRGWMLCDRRAEAPALFVAEVASPSAAPTDAAVPGEGATRRRRRPRRDDSTRNLFDEIAADISEAPIEVVIAPHLVMVEPEPVATETEPEPEPVATEPEPEPVAVEPQPEPEPEQEPEPEPELAVLTATSPLLARAFRQTGPQRSVLTQANGDEPSAD